MLKEVMDYYEFRKEFNQAGYFETESHQKIFEEITAAIHSGKLIALCGQVGCGKTTTLRRIQQRLKKERKVKVSKSLSVDKYRIKLPTLIQALFYDLGTGKGFKIPPQPERRERKLQELIRKSQKPVALFIDEAHDLHGNTLVGLKRLIELAQDGKGILSMVLVGQAKLKNDLRRSTKEEIGARAAVFTLEGIKNHERLFIEWVLDKCKKPKTKVESIITDETIEMLSDRLSTPLQIEHYLDLSFEEAYQLGQKPVTHEILETVLAKDINGMESRLTRHGYNVKDLADLLNVRPKEMKSFLKGQLAPGRLQEMKIEMLAAGVPI